MLYSLDADVCQIYELGGTCSMSVTYLKGKCRIQLNNNLISVLIDSCLLHLSTCFSIPVPARALCIIMITSIMHQSIVVKFSHFQFDPRKLFTFLTRCGRKQVLSVFFLVYVFQADPSISMSYQTSDRLKHIQYIQINHWTDFGEICISRSMYPMSSTHFIFPGQSVTNDDC